MTYEQVLKYINDTAVFGSKLGLDNITELLERLGNPQKSFRSVHIAGSNGKGSVASFISFILAASSYKTGLFTSPPIIDDRERICLVSDTKNEISKDDFALIGEKVINKCLEMVEDGLDHPTQFELYTALAYLYFCEAGVDIAVIEVGLGGRLDATNTITPDLSVICTISLEHTQYLGDTLSKVAFEKGGIIKNGVPVALYMELPSEAHERLLHIADERNSQVYDTANANIEILSSDFSGTTANIFYDDMRLNSIRIPLPGEHQVKNCTLALGAIKALNDKGYTISQGSIIEGIRRTVHKGRCEIVSTSPLVIYDGAHNPECAGALADYVAKNFKGKRKVLVFSMLSDKDQYHAACILKNVFDKFIVTHINTSRGESLVKLSELFRECTFVTPAVKAVEYAIQNAEENDVIFVSGSLALIEEINKEKTYR